MTPFLEGVSIGEAVIYEDMAELKECKEDFELPESVCGRDDRVRISAATTFQSWIIACITMTNLSYLKFNRPRKSSSKIQSRSILKLLNTSISQHILIHKRFFDQIFKPVA